MVRILDMREIREEFIEILRFEVGVYGLLKIRIRILEVTK